MYIWLCYIFFFSLSLFLPLSSLLNFLFSSLSFDPTLALFPHSPHLTTRLIPPFGNCIYLTIPLSVYLSYLFIYSPSYLTFVSIYLFLLFSLLIHFPPLTFLLLFLLFPPFQSPARNYCLVFFSSLLFPLLSCYDVVVVVAAATWEPRVTDIIVMPWGFVAVMEVKVHVMEVDGGVGERWRWGAE